MAGEAGRTIVVFRESANLGPAGHFFRGDLAGFDSANAADLVRSGAARYVTPTDLATFVADRTRGLDPGTHQREVWRGTLRSEKRVDGHLVEEG
jgi:hypothetical protein